MPSIISKIKLINFKRFRNYTVIPNSHMNILVGDNEVGKSSILEAIDIVACGSVKRVDAIGVDKLLNIEAVQQFNSGVRTFDNLPIMAVELYLNGSFDHTMNGKNNSSGIKCDGIRMICEPNIDYQSEITNSLNECVDYFPYDYYTIRFSTFSDEGYTGYKKKFRSVFIDSTNMNSSHATNDFIRRMYLQYTESNEKERTNHKSKYRQMKNKFCTNNLIDINSRVPADKNYTFGLKLGSSSSFENDLMIYENEVGIDSKGTGQQVFIKTDFALEHSGTNVDVILVEEPENHLSHINLRKLIKKIADTQTGQLFITTHNSLISTRLELKNILILSENCVEKPIMLKDLTEDTAKYFMKAPPANVIEFVLSHKAILVEGPSEYMLFEKFYELITNNKPEMDNIQIIDVRGLSFKRYLEIACLTLSKVAVVTDNDGDKQRYCLDKYCDYVDCDNIKIFYESDNSKRTFEVVLYNDNKDLCDKLFGADAQSYMLHNKTETAYSLLSEDVNINVPQYIEEAIEWIKK